MTLKELIKQLFCKHIEIKNHEYLGYKYKYCVNCEKIIKEDK